MPSILLVADDTGALGQLAEALATAPRVEIHWVHNGQTALDHVARDAPEAVIVDETVGGTSGLAWIREMLGINAFVQTAVVSRMPEGAFHEASEGLGIMLQLPPAPGREDAERLLEALGRMPGFGR